jgi:hypothetical protein
MSITSHKEIAVDTPVPVSAVVLVTKLTSCMSTNQQKNYSPAQKYFKSEEIKAVMAK